MAKPKQLFYVYIQGWGDKEDQFYLMGTYSTRAKADAELEKLLQGWEADGLDRADVEWEISEGQLDFSF